ncbi:MAG: hypothetical protein HYZ75_17995 [Elusimicrobia bacterium]|nr:hypothetical protein [Elusimicrobiota bacterium]
MNETSSAVERGGSFVCLAAAAGLLLLPLANPDIFWHLSAARWMVSHGAWPRADWLSHTKAGMPWADFEWLAQLLHYGVYRSGGLDALWLLKGILVGASGWALWRLLAVCGAGLLGRGLGVLAWLLVSPTANDLRPENFSMLFFFLLVRRLEERRAGDAPEVTPRALASIAGLFILWANLHAGFVYGLGLLALYGTAAAHRARQVRPLVPLAAAALAVLVNPYGPGVYAVPWQHWREIAELKTYILEWQEASVLSPWLAPFWATMVTAFVALGVRRFRTKEAPIEHAGLLGVLAWSAASHIRTSPYFSAAAVPVIASACVVALPPKARRAGVWLGAIAAVAFTVSQYGSEFAGGVGGFDPMYVPERAADFLTKERDAFTGKRLYNPWHWGGYLGWRLDGAVPVFVDGRYIFHDLLKGIYAAPNSAQAYGAFLSSHRIEASIIQRQPQFTAMPVTLKSGEERQLLRPFYVFYYPRTDWALVYWDEKALIFVRRDALGEDWIKAREFRWFRPDDLSAAALAVSEKDAAFSELAGEVNRWAASAQPDMARTAKGWLADVARAP